MRKHPLLIPYNSHVLGWGGRILSYQIMAASDLSFLNLKFIVTF